VGTFAVRATLSHPEQRESQVTLDLLVATGATWSLVPAGTARTLGIEPVETRPVKTADGRRLDLPVAEVRFTINGRSLTTPCLIGATDTSALLGAVTLEAFGFAADPIQRVLIPVTGLLCDMKGPDAVLAILATPTRS
jgi:clan AA aspartic protease